MTGHGPIADLARIARSFGPEHADAKRRLLGEIERGRRHRVRELVALQDLLCFLRAYPDDARVRRAVESVIAKLRDWLAAAGVDAGSPALAGSGLPGAVIRDEFSLPLLERLRRRLPDCLEIDWDRFEDDGPLMNALNLLVTPGECQGLDDISISLREWFAACRPARHATDLDFMLALFRNGPFDATTEDALFENCRVPIRYALTEPGTGRCEIAWPVERIHYQRTELDRRRRRLAALIRRPFPPRSGRLTAAAGEELIQLVQRALCARALEIRTLSYANARDVSLLACGRGVDIALIGVVPRYRDPLECHYCCFVFKNGFPIAYGPATVTLGCCEIGINLFPEFRGAEIRFIYPQFMRVLHQVLGARYFYLTPYGMGEANPAAIRTGAFWFYRKLGFRPTNPAVEELARAEEERMRREPGYRSSTGMLRRLSHTSAFFDLSRGDCRPLDLGAIGRRQSRFIAEAFGGDRGRAERECVGRIAQLLGRRGVAKLPPGERRAWELLAPILAMIPDIARWSDRDRQRLARILRRKGGASELGVDALIGMHRPLREALRAL